MLSTKPTYWDPCLVFNVDLAETTCRGKTLKGIRCKNPLNQAMRQEVKTVIFKLSQLDPGDVQMRDIIPTANLLLCNHYHRGAQDEAKAIDFYKDLQYFTARGSPRYQSKETKELIAAQEKAETALKVSKKLMNALQETSERIAREESKNKKLQAKAKQLELENEQHCRTIGTLKENNETSLRKVVDLECTQSDHETEIADLKATSKKYEGGLERVKTELEQEKRGKDDLQTKLDEQANCIDRKNNEIEALKTRLAEQSSKHESKNKELEKSSNGKSAILLQQDRLIDAIHAKLKVETQQSKILRKRSLAQCFIKNVQLAIRQQECDEIRADNDTLLSNQKSLQQALSQLVKDLSTLEHSLSPLRLDKMKRGLCTVVSIWPPRLRAHRVSGSDFTATRSRLTAG